MNMTSRARQVVTSPPWGAGQEAGRGRVGPARPVRLRPCGSSAAEVAGAALVLGASFALWAAFLAAVW